MRIFNKAILVLSAASILCIGGCKKTTEAPKTTDEVVQAVKSWNKEDVNALLSYIPADSPVVFVSTRQIDTSHPAFKTLLQKSTKYFDDSLKTIENELAKHPDESATQILSSMKSVKPLLENYEATAPEWGLNPKGHSDSVIYLNNDNSFVIKLTADDSQKLKSKLEPLLTEKLAGNKLSADMPEIKFTELKVGNSTWYVYDAAKLLENPSDCIACKDGKTMLPSMLAYNIDNNIITLTAVKSGDTASLEKALKVADKPLTKEALGKIGENVHSLGYVDNVKLFEKLSNHDAVKSFIKEEGSIDLSPVCIKDISSLIALFPKLNFTAKIENDGSAIVETVLAMSDAEELKKLQALTIEHLTIGSDNSLALINLNINIDKSIAYIQDLVKRASERKFECEAMNPLIPADWNEALASISNPQVKMFTSNITGINAAVDKLNMNGENIAVEAIANINGPALSSNYPMIAGMAALVDPKLGTLLSLKKDEIKNIDLSQVLQMPIKVNALLTDKDIVVGTDTYDVKSISSGKRTNDGTFFTFGFNTAIVNSLKLELGDVTIPDSTSVLSFGVNDKGLVFKSVSKL